jgi:hypothetical protein
VSVAELRGDIVILTCAISAGIHGALAPDHFHEGMGAGLGFVVATVLLAALVVILTRNPSQLVVAGAAAVFVGLIVSYALVVTTGVPVLHPEVEAVDGLALFTKAVEALGLITTVSLVRQPTVANLTRPRGTLPLNHGRAARPIPIALTTLVAVFSAVAALAVSNGMNMNMNHEHGNTPHQAIAPMAMKMTAHSSPTLSDTSVALRIEVRKH